MDARRSLRALTVLAMGLIATTGAGGQQDSTQPPTARQPAPTGSELNRQVRDIASSLRCPVCLGLSVQASPSDLAGDMKAVIRDMLITGRSPDEIRAYFVSRYGEWILLAPEPRGFNLLLWLVPFAALLAGAGVVCVVLRRLTRLAPDAVTGTSQDFDPYGPALGDAERHGGEQHG